MKQVIIMQGVPGSGKSTIAKRLLSESPTGCIVSADLFFMDSVTGEYRFNPKDIGAANASCLRDFVLETTCRGTHLVIVDNTNTTVAEVAPYYAIAEAYGYQVEVLRIRCDTDIAATRNVHGVHHSKVHDMYVRMLRQEWPTRWNIETETAGQCPRNAASAKPATARA